jgi:hypothetical protein
VNDYIREKRISKKPLPGSGKDINTIETLRAIHQCQELINNSIGDPSTVVPAVLKSESAIGGDTREVHTV